MRTFLDNNNGNIFAMLFGGVVMAGALGVTLMGMIRGPLSTSVELSRNTTTESYIMTNTKLLMRRAAGQANTGDCDTDGVVEPLPYKDAGPAPAGGGQIPDTIGGSREDPWGTPLGYCVWDHGGLVDDAACGGASQNRLQGSDTRQYTVMAVISAGADQEFQTSCNAFVDTSPSDGEPDTELVATPGGADDIVYKRSYRQATEVTAGLWDLSSDAADTATIDKDTAVGTKGASPDAGSAGLLFANNGMMLGRYDTTSGDAPPCNSPYRGMLIYATNLSSIAICDGSSWTRLAGGGGGSDGNFAPAYTNGTDATLTVAEDSGTHDISNLLEANDLNTKQSLEWAIGGTTPDHGVLNNFPQSTSAGVSITPPGTPQYEVTHANYVGTDSFSVDLTDGEATTTLNVTVDITPVNDAPIFDDGSSTSITLDEDTTQSINNVLSATDVDDNQTLTWSVSSGPSNGSLSGFSPNPTQSSGTSDASQTPSGLSYTPNADFNTGGPRSESFEIRVADGNGGSDTITVDVTVTPVNDAPVASNDGPFTLISHNTKTVDVISNDSDIDGDSLDVAGTTSPSTGSSSYSGDNVTYDPDDSSISGTINDSFNYTASDGSLTDTATVDFTVHHHHDYSQCYSNDRYWYHSGGGREDRRQNCGTCCSSDTCDADGGCCNNSRWNTCSGGDVWKKDQCGNLDYKVSNCSCGCSGGSCDSCGGTWEQVDNVATGNQCPGNTAPSGSCSPLGKQCHTSRQGVIGGCPRCVAYITYECT